MKQYQLRVQNEKYDLDCKIGKLRDFHKTPVYESLSGDEKILLCAQERHMDEYSRILGKRIAAFMS